MGLIGLSGTVRYPTSPILSNYGTDLESGVTTVIRE